MSTNFPWDRGSSAGRGKSKYTLKGNRVNLDSVPNGIPTKKVLELINEFSKVAEYNYAPIKKINKNNRVNG